MEGGGATMTATKPHALRVLPGFIPSQLKTIPAWVTWRYELSEKEKWTKVPYQQGGKAHASTTDPQTWTSFERAIGRYEQGRLCIPRTGVDGIGFVLGGGHGIVGVDLDHCFSENKIQPWALKIIFELDSYTEVSPSGTGVRIFLKASLPAGGRKKGHIEMYDSARFLTVTGHHKAGTPQTIEDRCPALEVFHHRVFFEPVKYEPNQNGRRLALTDSELLQRAFGAKNGDKVRRLYDGDWSGYGSQSEADLAFCGLLYFYTKDEAQLDRLFRASGLYREKWDRHCRSDGATYGQATIARASRK